MPVLMTRTEDIYLAAGLDAVVMLKTIEYGVQIFTPMAMLSLAIRMSPSEWGCNCAAHLQTCLVARLLVDISTTRHMQPGALLARSRVQPLCWQQCHHTACSALQTHAELLIRL